MTVLAASAWGQAMAHGKPAAVPHRPGTLVNGLYKQVVARHPIGVPYGVDMDIFRPYLSRALLKRFELNNACFADWRRQNPDPNLKPSIGMFEDGVFSGEDEKAAPSTFRIERTESRRDGSSRVYVRLAQGSPPDKPWVWYVVAVVISENARPVVDDVLYMKNKKGDIESRLSKNLSSQCNGAVWVGNGKQQAIDPTM